MNRAQEKVLKKAERLLAEGERVLNSPAPFCVKCHSRMRHNRTGYYCCCWRREIPTNPSCIKCRGAMIASGITAGGNHRWRCKKCAINCSRIYQSGVRGNHSLLKRKPEIFEQAKTLYQLGMSTRQVERLLCISKKTANDYQRAVLKGTALNCKCGRPLRHRGWCWWRYQQSPKRQEFIQNWRERKSINAA